jgi:hypothetical protein
MPRQITGRGIAHQLAAPPFQTQLIQKDKAMTNNGYKRKRAA